MTRLIALLAPACLLGVLIIWRVTQPDSLTQWLHYPGLSFTPYVLHGLAFLLAVIFRQSPIAFVALLLAGSTALTADALTVEALEQAQAAVLLTCIALPLNFIGFSMIKERGVISRYGIQSLCVVILQLIFLYIGVFHAAQALSGLYSITIMFSQPPTWLTIPEPGYLLLIFATAFLTWRNWKDGATGVAITTALWSFMVGLNFASPGPADPVSLPFLYIFASSSGAFLIYGIVARLWRSAFLDELTQLPGRRSMQHHLDRLDDIFSIAMVDLDHFKQVNDRHGHPAGDQVLRLVASRLGAISFGRAYRYGGEEFAVVAPGVRRKELAQKMNTLREEIADTAFYLRSSSRPRSKPKEPSRHRSTMKQIPITISVGVAEPANEKIAASEVLQQADKALYRAKRLGRNRVSPLS